MWPCSPCAFHLKMWLLSLDLPIIGLYGIRSSEGLGADWPWVWVLTLLSFEKDFVIIFTCLQENRARGGHRPDDPVASRRSRDSPPVSHFSMSPF